MLNIPISLLLLRLNTLIILLIIAYDNSKLSGLAWSPRGGGGTPLFKVYRFVQPQRVWFLSRFGLKTGIDFDNYGVKSGRIFGAGNIYESVNFRSALMHNYCVITYLDTTHKAAIMKMR